MYIKKKGISYQVFSWFSCIRNSLSLFSISNVKKKKRIFKVLGSFKCCFYVLDIEVVSFFTTVHFSEKVLGVES